MGGISYGSAAAVAFFCCVCVALVQGQLMLDSLPDLLFVNNSGVHKVELGTVIRARCNSSSTSAPLVAWFKDGIRLDNDPPHIRIRTRTSGSEVNSVLTIDNFDSGDDGDYYCEASDGTDTLTSTTLSLSVIDDDTIRLFRNPVDYEIAGGANDAVKFYDSIRDNRTAYELGLTFEPTQYVDSCCQTFRCQATIPGDQTTAANIGSLTVTWLRNEEEIVDTVGRTEIFRDLRYQTGANETRYISHLRLINFEESDIGVYQCVYSDFDTDQELVYSSPIMLDTDNSTVAMLEAVSPVDQVLDPPEKLVIEVESSGGYFRHAWHKNDEEMYPNGDMQFREVTPEKFSEFFQVFVQDPTTTSDHGVYRVDLIDDTTPVPNVLKTQEFTVTPPVSLSVEALNTTTVTVVEGEDVNISCIARANPLPSDINWSFAGGSTTFTNTSSTEQITASVPSAGMFSFTEGNITSTLHITAAEDPTHSGTYTCSSSNDTTTLSDTITVQVQVPPEVSVSATRSRILVGHSTNITCSISRTVPTDYTIEWTLTDTSGAITTLAETGETLVLTAISEDGFGTYTCNVTNSAGLSGSANITIEEGVAPTAGNGANVTFSVGDDLVLTAVFADFNLALDSIVWTHNLTDTLMNGVDGDTITNTGLGPPNANSTLTRSTITGISYAGMYVATATNRAGSSSTTFTVDITDSPVILSQPESYTFNESTEAVLRCIATGIPPANVYWQYEGEDITDGATFTITNTIDLRNDVYTTTSDLTVTSVQRSNTGIYTCIAANGVPPNYTVNSNLTVNFAPVIEEEITATSVLAPDPVTLTCTVAAQPTPDIVWIKEDSSGAETEYSQSGEKVMISVTRFDSVSTATLTLLESNSLDTANYSCKAGNFLGNTTSQPTQVTVFARSMFQLRLLGVSDCVQWKEIQPSEKKEAVIAGVVRAVSDLCQCDFSRDSFHEIDTTAGFQCFDASPTAVTFRAEILESDISHVIGYIEQWVASEPTVVVLSSRLSIDSGCKVEIESFSQPECSAETTANRDNNNKIGFIVGGILGGLLLLLLLITVVVVMAVLFLRSQSKASYKFEEDTVYETIPDAPIGSLELTNMSVTRNLPETNTQTTSISTEANPCYATQPITQDNPAYIKHSGTADNPTYATHNTPHTPEEDEPDYL